MLEFFQKRVCLLDSLPKCMSRDYAGMDSAWLIIMVSISLICLLAYEMTMSWSGSLTWENTKNIVRVEWPEPLGHYYLGSPVYVTASMFGTVDAWYNIIHKTWTFKSCLLCQSLYDTRCERVKVYLLPGFTNAKNSIIKFIILCNLL